MSYQEHVLETVISLLFPYGTVFRNTSHCNFRLLMQISFQIYNLISNITNQNDDIW